MTDASQAAPGSGGPRESLMLREIREIPEVVERLVREESGRAREAARAIARRRVCTVVIAARGSSDHAATYAKYLIEASLGIPVALAAASIATVYGAPLRLRDAAVVAISQSGQGPDIVGYVEAAREHGAVTVAVVNDPRSPLAEAVDHALDMRAGPERSVPATKTYVASLAAIALLVEDLAVESGDGGALGLDMDALPGELSRVLLTVDAWSAGPELVSRLAAADRCLVTSRGFNLATAQEVALKLKETTGVFADGYSAADLLHGPVAVAGPDVPALAFRPDGPMGPSIDRAVDALAAAGSPVWLVGGRESAGRDGVLRLVEDLPEALTPLAYATAGHLIAEAVGRARGLDPDQPIGLEKVTKTE